MVLKSLGISMYLVCSLSCYSQNYINHSPPRVVKFEKIVYIGGAEFARANIYAWDDFVLEERTLIKNYQFNKVDSSGKLQPSKESSMLTKTGYYLVELNKAKYYQFNEIDILTLNGNLPEKKDGIIYSWDLINESGGTINDFVKGKDSVINGSTFIKLSRARQNGSYTDTYNVLLKRGVDLKQSFTPVSVGLSKKYEGIISEFIMKDGKSGYQYKEIWKIHDPTESDLAKVNSYQQWYINHSK